MGGSGVVLHEAGTRSYQVAHRFPDRETMARWHASRERAELHDRLGEVADRVGDPERLSGLEPWFADVGRPPRWKMWLASFLRRVSAGRPLPVAASRPTSKRLPLLVRSAVLPLVLLSLMTYLVMPVVTRPLAGWLSSTPA